MVQENKINGFLQAATEGNQEQAESLLAEEPRLRTANIFTASMLGEISAAEAFLKSDPTLATRKGGPKDWDPLLYLSFSRFHKTDQRRARGMIQVAKLLLAHGADPNTGFEFESQCKLPVLWAACCEANHPALARVLLEAGANPNDGESIYHLAEKNYRESLELLKEFGANLSGPINPWNNTPLYFILGHKPLTDMTPTVLLGVQWLLENGADPNVPSYESESRPVHLAATNGWGIPLFELLSRHGADLKVPRKDGKTAYALAFRRGDTALVDWLRARGVETPVTLGEEFIGACRRSDEPAVRALLEVHPGLLNSLTQAERALIVEAAANNEVGALKLMLQSGLAVETRGNDGETPLHFAAWFGNLEAVQFLLQHRAPLELKDTTYDATPLGWAAHGSENCCNSRGNYPEVVQALLAAGAIVPDQCHGSPEVNALLERAKARK
jgi:ankyrin repeat protein